MMPQRTFRDEQRWPAIGLLIARAGFAVSLIVRHGYPKIPELFAEQVQFFDPLGLGAWPSLVLATFAEVVCAFAVLMGIFSRLACVPLIINFSVIVFVLHRLQVPGDRGALALLYLVAFLVLLMTGPGRYSIDEWLRRRRQSLSSGPAA